MRTIKQAAVGVAMAFLGATLALGTNALAHGGDASKIHSCQTSAGLLRVVGVSEACRSGETALDWDKSASAGGVTGYQVVTATRQWDPLVGDGGLPDTSLYDLGHAIGHPRTVVAICPVGKRVLGGGGGRPQILNNRTDALVLVASYPNTESSWSASYVSVNDGNGLSATISAYAICANASP